MAYSREMALRDEGRGKRLFLALPPATQQREHERALTLWGAASFAWDRARFERHYIDGDDLRAKREAMWEANRYVLLICFFLGIKYPEWRRSLAAERKDILASEARHQKTNPYERKGRIEVILSWAQRHGWPELDLSPIILSLDEPLEGIPNDLTLSAGEDHWRRNFSWLPRDWVYLVDLVEWATGIKIPTTIKEATE